MKFVWIGLAGLVGSFFLLLFGIGVMVESGAMPSTAVETGADLTSGQRAAFEEAGVISSNEPVLYYYSQGFKDFTAAGSILTESRVISFIKIDNVVNIHALPYSGVADVKLEIEGGYLTDATYYVYPKDEDASVLELILSVEDARHLDVISALKGRIIMATDAP